MTSFPTSLGTSSADEIRLLGRDLTADLMGQVGFGELAFWLVALRRPTPSETRVFEAVLVDDLALESGRRQGFGRVRSAAGPLARVTARGERINMHLSRNMTPSICIARDLVSRVVGRVAPWYTYDLKSRD